MASSNQSTNSHDDSIIIEVEDSPAATTRKSTRNSRLEVVDSSSSSSLKLCEFPVGHKDTVTVSSQDYATLEHDTFLNDIIIDFYLTHLFYNVLPSESKDSVHIFSTMFYKRLLQTPKKDAKKVAAFETDPSLSKEEKEHLRVAGWTKNVDLFNKDFVIVPICENSHWYLVVVVKPGIVNVAGEKKDSPAESQKGTDSSVESEKRKDILAESQKWTDSSVESEKRKDILAESQKGSDTSVESEKRKDTLVESEKSTDSSVKFEKKTDTPVKSEKRTYSDEKTDNSNSKDAERKTENQEDSKEETYIPENSEEVTDITDDLLKEKTDILDDSEEKTNNAEDSVEKKDQGKSFFLVLDSLGGTKRSSVTNLKNYLSYEWRSKKLCGELPFSFKQMKTIHPRKPEQENGSDCGIFLLHYAEKIFQDLDQFLQPDLPDLSHWFTMEEVGKKRAAIAVLIRRLAKQQVKGGDTPNFPDLKFKDESMARKSSKLIDSFSTSPVKDVNENVSKKEAVRCMKVTTRYVSTRSTCSKKGRQEKSAKRSSPSTNKESETSLEDDFSFDPSIYSDTTAVSSEMSEATKSCPNTASTISTSVSTSSASSSSPTNADAMSSSYTATSDTKSSISAVTSDAKSSISSGSSSANEASANFMDVWNASKNNLVLGDYARFASSSTAKQDSKVKRKRPGVDTFKSLQISKQDDGNTSSRSRSGAPEMNK